MTRSERLRYVNTVITASTDACYRREYNRIIALHMRLFSTGIHDKQQFLPWHRWYVTQQPLLYRFLEYLKFYLLN